MFPTLKPYLPQYTESILINIGFVIIEILVGLIMSIAANIYLLSLHFVGQILSMQSGLGAAAFFDPTQKSQVTLFSNFLLIMTITMIFASNTHHIFINAIVDSYIKFPAGNFVNSINVGQFIAFVINDSFILSFKIVSPFLIVSLAVMTGSGLLSRLMPNLQVFFVITPAQIMIMFCTMYIVIQSIVLKVITVIGNSALIFVS